MISKFSMLVLGFALALAWVTSASAQTARYPITGNAQYQIGDGLPIPIAGGIPAVPGAAVRQPTQGPDPRPMTLSPGSFTHPGTPFNLPLFMNNSNVFQVLTAIPLQFPQASQPAMFMAGGRTGRSTVSWCPGLEVTPAGNPGCANPAAGPGINGLMRYTKTTNQFGGPARGNAGGFADVALRASAGAACDYATNPGCLVIFALATPQPVGAQGATFNVVISTDGDAPSPGLFQAVIQANGLITFVTPTGLGPGLPNPATSVGAPWTTGMLSLSNTAALGSPEIFTLSGSDTRVNGIGTLSLVTGSMSDRTLSGPNANRGWLTITVGQTTPTLGTWGIGALALVLAGAAARRIRKTSAA